MIDAIPVVFTSALGHRDEDERELPISWLGRTTHAITQTPQVWIDHHAIEDGDRLVLSWDVLEDHFPAGMVEAMRSEEHTSELQSLMRISYAVFCLKKKKNCSTTLNSHNKA